MKFVLDVTNKTVTIIGKQVMVIKKVTVRDITFFQGNENESTLLSNKDMVIPKGRAIRILEALGNNSEFPNNPDMVIKPLEGKIEFSFSDL